MNNALCLVELVFSGGIFVARIPGEHTPDSMSEKLCELCESISHGSTPVMVPVRPGRNSIPRECFANVDAYINAHGGHRLLGWRLLQWANILVEGEAHAVWESEDGILLDVTPYDEPEILFLPDPTLTFNGYRIMNRRLALTGSPLVAELIALHNQFDEFQCNAPVDEPIEAPKDLLLRINRIRLMLQQDAGRNDLCPCQSGLKFKKCCGR